MRNQRLVERFAQWAWNGIVKTLAEFAVLTLFMMVAIMMAFILIKVINDPSPRAILQNFMAMAIPSAIFSFLIAGGIHETLVARLLKRFNFG